MELLSLVKEKLLPGHKLNNVFEVDLVESLIKSTRILALIESENEETESSLKAVLVYQTVRVPVRSSIDLTLDVVIPVNGILKCEVGSSTADLVLVNLSTGEMKFVFEMPFSEQTNSFVSDIYKSTEAVKSQTPEFSWLNPYIQLSQKSKQVDGIQKDAVLTFNSFTNENDSSESFTSYGATYTHKAHLGIDQENHTFVHPSPSLAARENEIKKEMEAREDKYTYFKNYTVFVGTWNVNGQYPSIGLSEWLACDEEPPDFYAIAFQELDLNTEAFLFNVTPREQEWLNAVANGVHPKARYLKVRFVRLVGIMLIVLAKEEHIAHIRNVAVDTVGTGIMNKMGNKGGVSVRFELHNTSIVFINAHMAAHVEEVERRNEDHDLILARTDFRLGSSEYPKRIENHDHIYFFGDMNYRINKPRESDIKTLANKGNLKVLFEYDQLTEQKRIGRIFANYNEGLITFQPTFKYDLNSDNWDSSEKMRQPAWCDRILWKGTGIKQLYYRSHPTLRISDHKAVSALFYTRIKVIDSVKYRVIYEEVMKNLDKMENENLPQVVVDTNDINFGSVKFLEPKEKFFNIKNTGKVVATFLFSLKPDDKSCCKPWLSINPYKSSINPGDECRVKLKVEVEKDITSKLNIGAEKLYDILILHLDGGKDIFITVSGDYERSCFGSSIKALIHIKKPFKDVTISELLDLESGNPKNLLDAPYAIPKELWYLVDHIVANGLNVEGLFTTKGLKKELYEIRSSLDSGVPSEYLPGGIHSVAEAMLLFLESLAEPVIPFSFYEKALEATRNFSLCQGVIQELPDCHRNVFDYLINFQKELLKHSNMNGLDVKTLAHVFGIVLIRSPTSTFKSESSVTNKKKHTFIYHFLVNDYD